MLKVIYVRFQINILNIQLKKEKQKKANMIHNLKTIEITMNKKEPNILTKNLTNYQYNKKYKN